MQTNPDLLPVALLLAMYLASLRMDAFLRLSFRTASSSGSEFLLVVEGATASSVAEAPLSGTHAAVERLADRDALTVKVLSPVQGRYEIEVLQAKRLKTSLLSISL